MRSTVTWFGLWFFKALFGLVLSLIVLMVASFLLLKLLPGGPFHDETILNPVVRESLAAQWNLDQSLGSQFQSYFSGWLRGDWGVSMVRPQLKVYDIIHTALDKTLLLSLSSLLFVIIMSFTLAIVGAYHTGNVIEKLIDQLAIAFISLPSLFWGPLLIFIFGFYLDILPVAFLSTPSSFILPVLTLTVRPIGSLTRLLKKSLEENLQFDYVRTAKSKGLSRWKILCRHVLRNSMIPFLAYLGPLSAGLISGSFLVEVLFSIPGLGLEFAQSLTERDYTVLLGLTVFYGILLLTFNGICDVLMRLSDPRFRGAQ